MSLKLYYGNGTVGVEGSEVNSVRIRYRGAIEIDDKTPEGYHIRANNNKITIMRYNHYEKPLALKELFNYVGEFKITSVSASNSTSGRVYCTIRRTLDYSELINSTSETMTIKSEDMSAGYTHSKRIPKTILKQPYIENVNTSDNMGLILFLEDGSEYSGYFHIHIDDNVYMTGKTHDENSKELFYKQIDAKRNIIDKLVSMKFKTDKPQRRMRGRIKVVNKIR